MRLIRRGPPTLPTAVLLLGIAATFSFFGRADARSRAQGDAPATSGNAAQGAQIFAAQGCNKCHGPQAQGMTQDETTNPGPRIAGVSKTLPSFIAYVRNPNDPMPFFSTKDVSDAQLTDVYAFLQSLSEPGPASSAAAGSTPASPAPMTQSGNQAKQPMAEDVFKDVQVLKGIPVSEFMSTMGFLSDSIGESCEYCHAKDDTWADYADNSNGHKETTRKMLRMMFAINKDNFGGRREVTCYSCHNGGDRPKVAPTIAGLYSAPPPDSPDDASVAEAPDPGAPTADQILDKYIEALGGSQKLAALTSFAAKGKSVGYGDEAYERPVDIFAQAPNKRTVMIHTLSGDNDLVYDGHGGWTLAPATAAPVPLLPLIAGDLENAKMDADLAFPVKIKQELSGWRVGSTTIDDHPVEIVQGNTPAGLPVRLYFDAKSGLLVRLVRYTDSMIGRNTTQIDYSDYRDVAGVKMPFHWVMSWLDGRTSYDLSEVKPNVTIEAAKFGKPVQVPPKAAAK